MQASMRNFSLYTNGNIFDNEQAVAAPFVNKKHQTEILWVQFPSERADFISQLHNALHGNTETSSCFETFFSCERPQFDSKFYLKDKRYKLNFTNRSGSHTEISRIVGARLHERAAVQEAIESFPYLTLFERFLDSPKCRCLIPNKINKKALNISKQIFEDFRKI